MPIRHDAQHARTPLDHACEHLAATNEQTLDWQVAVTRIAAPTGDEAARGAWMATQFAALGWDAVSTDTVGNVIARRRRDNTSVECARAVWCCAHLDTVFPDKAPTVTRDGVRLRGPGIGDNGRGLAALLAIADALRVSDVHTQHEIVLTCTVGEEGLGDLRGMKQLFANTTEPPVAVIALDGAGDERIVHTALGCTRWRIAFNGPGGHSWVDSALGNPLHAAALLTTELQAIRLPREPRTTLAITRAGGGESINSIPREAWIEVDIRSLSTPVLTDLERALRQTVARVERRENVRHARPDAPITSSIMQIGNRPGGVQFAAAPIVQLAMQVTRDLGITPLTGTGSTDANIPIARGVPAVAIGAGGRGGGAHTPDEWYDDVHGVRGLERALRLIVAAATSL
jgi:tripeptide aminopeptidase